MANDPQAPAQAPSQPQSQLSALAVKRDTADVVAAKVHQLQQAGELALPANYAVVNALKSAWLILQTVQDSNGKLALTTCTKDSIYNTMLDMVVQGLNPAKKQCYFIPYGGQLTLQRSYFGDEQVVRNIRPDVDVYSAVIYDGDDLKTQLERGRTRVTRHVQAFANIDPAKILGAYCIIEDGAGNIISSALMTIAQIRESWRKSKTYKAEGGNSFHHTQPDQACLRTVIRRACKPVINSSNDAWLLQAVQREEMAAEAEMDEEARANANGDVIDVGPPAEPSELASEVADDRSAQPAALPAEEAETPSPARQTGAPKPGKTPAPATPARQQTLGVGGQATAAAAAGPGF